MLEKLKSKLLTYQKEKNALYVSVLRYLLAEVKNKEIDLRAQGKPLSDVDIVAVLKKQIKQREDSIQAYKEASREDLVQQESAELTVLEELSASLC